MHGPPLTHLPSCIYYTIHPLYIHILYTLRTVQAAFDGHSEAAYDGHREAAHDGHMPELYVIMTKPLPFMTLSKRGGAWVTLKIRSPS